jgi:hypothetical protein
MRWFWAAGLVGGFLTSFAVTARYESHALIAVRSPWAFRVVQAAGSEMLSRHSLAVTILTQGSDLYQKERAVNPLEDVEEEMLHDLVLTHPRSSERNQALLDVRFVYRDPIRAQAAMNHLVSNFSEYAAGYRWPRRALDSSNPYRDEIAHLKVRIALLEKRIGLVSPSEAVIPTVKASDTAPKVDILERPSLPTRPFSPNRFVFAAVGLGIGIALDVLRSRL